MRRETLVWILRVYAAGLVGTLGVIASWEILGWWGALMGLPLIAAFYAAMVDPSPRDARAGGAEGDTA